MNTVLIGEDEPEIRNYLKLALQCEGFHTHFAQNGDEVLASLSQQDKNYSALLLDIFMPFRDGIDTLKEVRKMRPDLPVIMMSVAATPSNVVTAMNYGATDFLPKPIGHADLRKSLEKAIGRINAPAAPAPGSAFIPDGTAPSLAGTWAQKIDMLLEQIGSSDVPVLLQGETGVGKEVVARKLHARSKRANGPFLKLNCAALPSELVESELFGYEKGAFTGAFKNTPGKFEMANGGTIFLDEIGDMDFRLQAKLLQVLQDREFLRLGAKQTSRVDVRIMAASHCDFEQAIQKGKFREDLYYRLNIVDIHIPPLRERRDEIIPLAHFFLQKYATPERPALEIPSALSQVLLEHTWPGNVRELENTMQKYLVLRDPALLAQDVCMRMRKKAAPAVFNSSTTSTATAAPVMPPEPNPAAAPPASSVPATVAWSSATAINTQLPAPALPQAEAALPDSVSPLSHVEHTRRLGEAQVILNALNSTLWNRKQAAAMLNVDYKALLYKMKKLGIGEKRPDPAVLVKRPPAADSN